MGKTPIVHVLLIIILGLLAYSNTFNVPFQFDDNSNIVENYKLRDLSNFWPPSVSRWLGFLTFALNYKLGGLDVLGYHIVNLSIHILNAILVYWLVVLTFKTPFFRTQNTEVRNQTSSFIFPNSSFLIALFSALIFVSQPVQTQAVTYIVQRFTSLVTMFYLLSLVMYIKFRLTPSLTLPHRGGVMGGGLQLHAARYTLYAVSLISAIFVMKTKEIAFTLPVVIALYEFMFFEEKFKKRLLYLIPLLLTMLIIPLSIIGIDKPVGDVIGELRETVQETEEIPRWSYLFTQFRVVVTYIRLLFLPINQNLDYDYPIYHSFFNPEVFLSFLFLLLIFSLGIYLLYSKRYKLSASRLFAFGIFWFFITLSVESSIIPIRDVIFEHRMYLPLVGTIIAFSAGIFYFISRIMQHHASRVLLPTVYSLLTIIVIVFSIVTYQRNTVWQDEVSLWEDVVRKSPEKARGHNNLGNAYGKKGMPDKAIQAFQTVLKLKPNDAEAHNNIGAAYADQELLDEAIQEYNVALRLKPASAKTHYNIGNAYIGKGWTDKAIEHYQIALRLNPNLADAHYALGNICIDKRWVDKATEHYQTALRLNPNLANAHYNLGLIYLENGVIDKARKEFEMALQIKPDYYQAQQFLNYISKLK